MMVRGPPGDAGERKTPPAMPLAVVIDGPARRTRARKANQSPVRQKTGLDLVGDEDDAPFCSVHSRKPRQDPRAGHDEARPRPRIGS
jgi:hypothetical protein